MIWAARKAVTPCYLLQLTASTCKDSSLHCVRLQQCLESHYLRLSQSYNVFQWLSWQVEHERPSLWAQFLKNITLLLSETTKGANIWLLWPQFCKYIVPTFSETAEETGQFWQPQPPQFCRYIALVLSDASAETGLTFALIADSRKREAMANRVNNIYGFIFPQSLDFSPPIYQ